MITNFVVTDTDAADIPDRLRFKGWIASARRFARQRPNLPKRLRFRNCLASAVRFIRQIVVRLSRLIKQRLQPRFDILDPQQNLNNLLNSPQFAWECTTALQPINLDWYQFFTISPPLTLQGTYHD
ncbi:hypothetical protein [Nodosilinea nodulosa]|uniref:hypothetical protein n=1 Tax=Nodosilinea nodulosa TaxID=416001 RepID=UPI0012D78FDF|nr:hypothetical protein [Nodosilinea nodulosa]